MTESVCALGFFDGVHEAHSLILKNTVTYAKEHKLKSIALTFEKSPAEFFGKKIKYLTPLPQKKELMMSLGIDEVVVLPCNETMLSLSPEDFFDRILVEKLNAVALFCGFNYTFGKGARGDASSLTALAKDRGIEVFVSPRMTEDGLTVSSTEIRNALEKGNIELANHLLTRPFQASGVVCDGKHLGREMNFATANIYPDSFFPSVPYGVYATKTTVSGKEYLSVTNVGINPTVGGETFRIETHIHDFADDIYGKFITVKFYKFLRKEQCFSSIEELKKQITKDKQNTIEYFTKEAQ